ncbi:MAG: hypothetical protein MI757_11350, partial [Pirellulales bacterium]|nr:hypothetical protein [Pirellulales bacterium]
MTRITELAAALYEGDLSPESRAELRKMLSDDTQAVDDFVVECFLLDELSGRLGEEQLREQIMAAAELDCEADEDAGAPQAVVSRTKLLERASRHPFGVGVAVAFVVTASVIFTLAITPLSSLITKDDASNQSSLAAAKEIATLTNWHRPEWVKEHAISPRNHRITAGQKIAFTSGLIEITYDTGAKVVIEGPAEFVVGGKQEAEGGKEGNRHQGTKAKKKKK